jgi:hypothetical protein
MGHDRLAGRAGAWPCAQLAQLYRLRAVSGGMGFEPTGRGCTPSPVFKTAAVWLTMPAPPSEWPVSVPVGPVSTKGCRPVARLHGRERELIPITSCPHKLPAPDQSWSASWRNGTPGRSARSRTGRGRRSGRPTRGLGASRLGLGGPAPEQRSRRSRVAQRSEHPLLA